MNLRWTALLLLSPLLLSLPGCGTPSFLITPVSNASELDKVTVEEGRGGSIAIIPVEGTLVDERAIGIITPSENPLNLFIQQLNEVANDDSVKAVVLRVNSPGGSVTTSDTMYDALVRFRQQTHKPVVASAQEVDASGAYYVSCGADKIVVAPTSIVGSIGVIFESFDFQDTLAKLGIQPVVVKSAPLKDMGSPFKHLDPQAQAIMQEMVDEYYGRFKTIVFSNRPVKDPATQTLVSDGRVFSGQRATQLGLADSTGHLNDAIDLARQMANAPGAAVVMYKRPYAYSGSIYAEMPAPTPTEQASVSRDLNLRLSLSDSMPTGFYYLWKP
jgi:protease IV